MKISRRTSVASGFGRCEIASLHVVATIRLYGFIHTIGNRAGTYPKECRLCGWEDNLVQETWISTRYCNKQYTNQSINQLINQSVYLSICSIYLLSLSIYLSILAICSLSIYHFLSYLSTYQSINQSNLSINLQKLQCKGKKSDALKPANGYGWVWFVWTYFLQKRSRMLAVYLPYHST